MDAKNIKQVTLHDSIHTPGSGVLGPVLLAKATPTTKPVKFDFETFAGQLFLVVSGTSSAAQTKGQSYRILVPMTQVKNIDVEPVAATTTLKAAK